jgi:cytidyltransferase-like protein
MATVMAFGTFDHVHRGHEHYLKKAKGYGELIVLVALDQTVEKLKGRKPSRNEKQRLADVKALGIADKVILGSREDKLKAVEEHKPDVICLGYDQNSFTASLQEKLKKRGLSPKIVRVSAFMPELYKSSVIKLCKI